MVKQSTQKIYFSGEHKLTEYSTFLYEVSVYKIWKDRIELHDSKFYTSKQPIKFKPTVCIKMGDYRLVKYITWLSAPLDYMLNNGFKLYDDNNRRRGSKPKSSKRVR